MWPGGARAALSDEIQRLCVISTQGRLSACSFRESSGRRTNPVTTGPSHIGERIYMSVKFVKTAARAVAAGAVVALGVASAPAALADPAPVTVQVPCSVSALAADITDATSGETLNLTVPCTYVLTEALPDISTNLTIQGGGFATLERSFAVDTPAFSILAVNTNVDLVLNHVNFSNGDAGSGAKFVKAGPGVRPAAASGRGGAIDNESGIVTVNGGVFSGNTAGESGGAIYNDNELTVNKATFTGNTAAFGGAIENDNE